MRHLISPLVATIAIGIACVQTYAAYRLTEEVSQRANEAQCESESANEYRVQCAVVEDTNRALASAYDELVDDYNQLFEEYTLASAAFEDLLCVYKREVQNPSYRTRAEMRGVASN